MVETIQVIFWYQYIEVNSPLSVSLSFLTKLSHSLPSSRLLTCSVSPRAWLSGREAVRGEVGDPLPALITPNYWQTLDMLVTVSHLDNMS